MNRPLKDATVKRYHDETHEQLKRHLQLFLDAYNHAKRLKTLKGLTPYAFICKAWTEEPERFITDPTNHTSGLNSFFEDDQLLRNAHRLNRIRGTIIQGRYDVATPARTAWELHRAWSEATFHLVPSAGHAFNEPGILDCTLSATDEFAKG